MPDKDSNRRKFLSAFGVGLGSFLAGCSDQVEEITSGESNEVDDGTDHGEETSGGTDPQQPEDLSPEDSQYVEDGELTVRPFVGVYEVYSRTTNSINIVMNAMPSPVEDYEITVHYTPLDEVESEWVFRTVKNMWLNDGRIPEYNHNTGEWEVPTDTTHHRLYERQVKEHGEQIDTIEIPSSASGILSEDVTDPVNQPNAQYTYEEVQAAEEGDPAMEWYQQELGSQIPDIGKDYHPAVNIDSHFSPEELFGVGSFTAQTNPTMYPYIYEVELDFHIPFHKPYVLTFGIEADKAPDVDPDMVVAQTPQTYHVAQSNGLVTPNRIPVLSGNPQNMQNDWSSLRRSGGRASQDVDGYDVDVPSLLHFNDANTSVPNLNFDMTSDTVDSRAEVRVTRMTNYGRLSPQLKELAALGAGENPEYITTVSPGEDGLFDGLPGEPNSPLQNLWSAEYEVTVDEVLESQNQFVYAGAGDPDRYKDAVQSPSVQNSPIIDSLANDLVEIADSMNAVHPSEQVQVVKDFVQHIPHVAGKDPQPLGADLTDLGTEGIQHPHWTLFNQTGDCQDLAVLANVLLRKAFDFDPTYGFTDDIGDFTDEIAGHVSTAVSYDDLGISDFTEEAIRYDSDNPRPDGLTFSSNGEQYVYIEMSGPFPIGQTTNRFGDVEVYSSL